MFGGRLFVRGDGRPASSGLAAGGGQGRNRDRVHARRLPRPCGGAARLRRDLPRTPSYASASSSPAASPLPPGHRTR